VVVSVTVASPPVRVLLLVLVGVVLRHTIGQFRVALVA
jgi:hypothetical protein